MADKDTQQKEVQSTEEVDNSSSKSEEPVVAVEDESRSENGDAENGDSTDKAANGKEASEEKNGAEETTEKVCSIKRKSTGGGDAVDGTPAEGATPEKKAKLDETAEAESNNGEAEVAA